MKKLIYTLLLAFAGLASQAQIIYQHDFGTIAFGPINPYTVAPTAIDPNLNSSSWSTAPTTFTCFAGSLGKALSLSNSSGTPTYSLSFNVASGSTCDISAFSFWRLRTTTGASNWTLTVNGTTLIGAGTTPTVGANTGTIAVTNPVNGLTGTVNVVLQLGGASGTGTFRLDDFTLYGVVTSTSSCTPPTTQASIFTSSSITNTSANVSWTTGSGSNVIVLARLGSAVNATPSNGAAYTANSTYALGQQVGTGNYVVYNGVGTSVNVTGLSPTTTYYFSVFEYNSTGNCYLLPGLTGNLLTTGTAVSSCIQVQGILVDACNTGVNEYDNEMVRFKTGATPVQSSSLSISSAGSNGVWTNAVWTTTTQAWHGIIRDATTASAVAGLNLTIKNCGFIKEPLPLGIIPPNSTCILVSSPLISTTVNSFAYLTDTIYMIFQGYGASSGQFANGTSTGPRSFCLIDLATGCRDSVYYDCALLTGGDGAAVDYDIAGNATYVNRGCTGAFVPLTVDAGLPNKVCMGSSQNLSAVASGVYSSVVWSLGAGATGTISSINSLNTTYTPGAGDAGTIKLYCSLKACPSSTTTVKDSVNLTVLQLPSYSINATNGYSLCPLASTILSYSLSNASATGTMSTAWSSPAATTNTYAVSAPTGTAPVTYTLNLTNFCGVASQTVNVYPLASPSITITAPTLTACAGSTVTVNAVSNSGNYSWSNPSGAVTSSVVLTANTTTTGVVTTTNSCGTKTDTYTLTVTQQPTVSISPSAVSLCTGQSATVTASANTAVTYTWSGTGVTGLNTNTVSLNTAGNYTVSASNVCNTSTAQVNVVVTNTPSITLGSTTSTLLCGGAIATLTTSGSGGSILWSNGDSTPTTTVALGGVYSATVNTPSCGSASNTISITAVATPTLSVNSNSVTICAGQSATLTATSNITPFQWSTGAITNTVLVSPLVNTSYTVGVSNACGAPTQTVNVSISPVPTLSIAATSLTICNGVADTLSLSGSNGAYLWNPSSATSQTLSITAGGTYIATVTTVGCGTATTSITIADMHTPTLTVSSNTAIVCNNTPIVLSATSTYTNNYSWLPLAASTHTLQVLTPLVYTVSSTNMCGTAVKTITVTNGATPSLTVVPSGLLVCPGKTVSISVVGGASYNWTGVSSTSSVVSVSAGVYVVSSTNACGTGSQTITVNTSTVSAGLSGTPLTGTQPLNVSFTDLSLGATSYTWNYGNGNTSNSSLPINQTYTAAGVYTVALTVTNNNGCADTKFILVNVKFEDPTIIIPNVFTPNNDSVNDVFYINAVNIADFNCVIFDRWGLQMYSWSSVKGGWDGRTAGKSVPDGTYFYMINATDLNGNEIKKQGSFQLLK